MFRPIPSHLRIAVGSTSAPKVQCVRSGIARWQQLPRFAGVSVEITEHKTESGVPDQPIGHEQTAQGAINRARSLHASGVVADFYVGIEGGVDELHVNGERHAFCNGYVYVWDGARGFLGSMGAAPLSPQLHADIYTKGISLGDSIAAAFQREHINHEEGFVGVATDNLITRADFCAHGFLFAFMPFWQPWYGAGE